MGKKKVILCISPLPPPYMGPTMATEIILNSRLKEEFTLVHLDTSDHRELDSLSSIDLRNIYLALKHYLLLVRLIIAHKPEMVYMQICQTTLGYLKDAIFILISKMLGCKVICHLRGGNFKNWYKSASPLTRGMVRVIHSLVDGQVVLGKNLRHMFKEILPEEKIFVVPNGKNAKACLNEKKTEKTRVLFLSNFIREKGVLDVLNAVPIVFKKHQNVEFDFVGNWWDKDTRLDIENFLYQNKILPINIKGLVTGDSKYMMLSQADVFIFPTYYAPEGHPWVIVEAMAAGLPIISTDQGAIKESVRDGENGFIIDKRSPNQIADKINFLIENPSIKEKMGEKSRRLYLDHFTEDKMIRKLGDAFNTVLAR